MGRSKKTYIFSLIVLLCASCAYGAITWNIIDDSCDDISGWIDNDVAGGVSIENPAGQFEFDSGTTAGANAARGKLLGAVVPDSYTLEVRVIINACTDYNTDGSYFAVQFYDSGFLINTLWDSTHMYFFSSALGAVNEVGTNVSDIGVWHTWRIVVKSTKGAANATANVYKDGVLIAAGVDCAQTGTWTEGKLDIATHTGTDALATIAHIDFIRISSQSYPASQIRVTK